MAVEWVARLTWEQTEKLDKQSTLCVFPVSALEQHGKHLPLGTDDVILMESLKALDARCRDKDGDVLIFPPLHYGNSVEHLGFCGTVSLKLETLVALVRDLVSSAARSGFKNVLLLNSHGGNTALLQAMAQELHELFGVRVFTLSYWATDFFEPAADLIDSRLDDECHAGEIETSLLLHWQPETVSREGLGESDLDCTPVFHPLDGSWLTTEISESGVMGNASFATPEKGEALANLLVDSLEEAICSIVTEIRRPLAGSG